VVLKVDRFGNLITNITPADAPSAVRSSAPRRSRSQSATGEITEIRQIYAGGAPGEIFGILGSMGFLEIAANREPPHNSRPQEKAAT